MSEDRLPRKLAAIFYADVVGYSRLIGEDEEGTHRQLKSMFEVVAASINTYGGSVVKYAGDAVLAQFPTVTDALASAADVQQTLFERNRELPDERKIQFRIGVNLGEVIVDGDDIHGDGVNVAARLEGLAEPGGICISDSVKSAVGKKLHIEYESLGEQQVKNIADPVRAYHARLQPGATLPEPTGVAKPQTPSRGRLVAGAAVIALVVGSGLLVWFKPWAPEIEPALDHQTERPPIEKPSIAVLPFNNVSGDPEQDYFSDGISEDIITDLSRVSGLKVIDRNSSFTYKGKAVKLQQVGKDLGAQYVLLGSVRRAGNRVRITTQLAKAADGYQLWADRYDREQGDIFALQDEITEKIISALLIKLSGNERDLLTSRPTRNFEAYDVFLQGQRHFKVANKEDNLLAQGRYRQAIELDPGFGRAYGAYAVALAFSFARGWSDRP
jgi:adenylate cyclase